MPFTPKLTYKGKPLVRKDNELYYGCMTDPYVLYLQIQSTKTVGGVDVADKVHLQLLSTDESKPREARVARQTTKNNQYNKQDKNNKKLKTVFFYKITLEFTYPM